MPIGTKTKVTSDKEDFQPASSLLQRAKLVACDFEDTISEAQEGDVIFADPPYTVNHNLNGFRKYNQRTFSWEDQLRLQSALRGALRKGAVVVLTNADHHSVVELYKGFSRVETIERHSVIAGSANHRRRTSEAIIVMVP